MNMTATPVCLLGKSVRLWPMEPEDAAAMFEIHGDPRVSRYTSTRPPHQTVDETATMITNMLGRQGAELWMIGDRRESAPRHGFGWVGLFSPREGVADIAINLRPDAQNLRRAREASVCAMLHGFEQRGFNRIAADMDVENTGAIRMAQMLGLSHEGCLRQYWKTPYGWRDSVIYSILASELERVLPLWRRYLGGHQD